MLTMKQTFACVLCLLFLAVQARETCATSRWECPRYLMKIKNFSDVFVKDDIKKSKFKKVCCEKKTYENCNRNAKEFYDELLKTPEKFYDKLLTNSTIENLNEQITLAIQAMNLEFENQTLKSHNAKSDKLWENDYKNEITQNLQTQDLKFSVKRYRRHEKQVIELRGYLSLSKGRYWRDLKEKCSNKLDDFEKKLKKLKTSLLYDLERVELEKLAMTFKTELAEAITKNPDEDDEFKEMLQKVTVAEVSEICEKGELETMQKYLGEYTQLKNLNASSKLPYFANGLHKLHDLINIVHAVHFAVAAYEIGHGLGAVALGVTHATVGGVIAGALITSVGIALLVLGGVIYATYKFAHYAEKAKLKREDRMNELMGFVVGTYWQVYNVRKVTNKHENLKAKVKKDANAHFGEPPVARTDTKIARTDTELTRTYSLPKGD